MNLKHMFEACEARIRYDFADYIEKWNEHVPIGTKVLTQKGRNVRYTVSRATYSAEEVYGVAIPMVWVCADLEDWQVAPLATLLPLFELVPYYFG